LDIKRAPPKKTKQYIMWAAGIVGIVAVSIGVANLKPAAPTVEKATLWIDSVRRGEMKREVHAPGTLVPEQLRIVAAVTAGRVEELPVRPGVTVDPATTIVVLSNTDVELQALQSEQQLTQTQSALASLRTSLLQQRLAQEGQIAQVNTQLGNAKRNLNVLVELDKKKLASASELAAARDLADELETRLKVEKSRLAEMQASEAQQIQLMDEQVRRLRAIVGEQRNRVGSMRVLAGASGQLQTLGNPQLEVGQWVNPGLELARIAQPGRLKAVLRVPETQAKDIVVGQKATIDLHNNGIIEGHVMRTDPSSQNGTVTVEVALDSKLPDGARSDLSVDGTIEIERLKDVMYVGRPAYGQAESTVGLFKLEADGKFADRANVKLGRASVNTIEVISGLNVGDKVIISDMSAWDNVSRVKLK
jgi:HlyD family secretion protein